MPLDALDVVLDRQIAAAKTEIARVAGNAPDRWWTAFELKTKARNGWSAGTMDLALCDLLDEGRLERRQDLKLRAPR